MFDNRVKFLDREQQFIEEYKSRKVAFMNKVVKRKDTVKVPNLLDEFKMEEYDLNWYTSSLIRRSMHELYRIGGSYISTTPWTILHSPAIERLVKQNVASDKWEPVRDFEVFVNNPRGVKWAAHVGNDKEREKLISLGEQPETECLLMSYHYPLCGLATQISIKINRLSYEEVGRRQIGLEHDVFDLCADHLLFIKKMKQLEILIASREKRDADIVEDELEIQRIWRDKRNAIDQ